MKQYILTHGNILAMKDRTITYDTDIFIKDGKIQRIGKDLAEAVQRGTSERTDWPECDTEVLDIRGRYVIPGLIDGHCHYDADYMGKLFLACGITSVRNMRGYKRHAEYAAETLAGRRTGP